MLRQWQAECAADALRKFQAGGQHHYFCQGTPGAGKTTLAAEVALRLVQSGMIDLILCFSPSLIVADGIKRTFENKLGKAFTGGLGAIVHIPEWSGHRFRDYPDTHSDLIRTPFPE